MVRYICRLPMLRGYSFCEGMDLESKISCGWGSIRAAVNTSHWYDGFTLFKRSLIPALPLIRRQDACIWQGRCSLASPSRSFVYCEPSGTKGNRVIMPTPRRVWDSVRHECRGISEGQIQGPCRRSRCTTTFLMSCRSTRRSGIAPTTQISGATWNREDLSILRDQQFLDSSVSLDSGGRALELAGRMRPKRAACP